MAEAQLEARLVGKIVSLVGLLATVVWFAKDQNWESGAGVITCLGGFALLEAVDQKQLRMLPERLTHDRELFDKLDGLLPEQNVRDQLEGALYNHETSRTFIQQMDLFHQLATTEAGDFLDPKVQQAFEPYVTSIAKLRAFISKRFFTHGDVDHFALHLALIRFRGHFPKGGYDVQNGINQSRKTGAPTVHRGVHGRRRPAGLG